MRFTFTLAVRFSVSLRKTELQAPVVCIGIDKRYGLGLISQDQDLAPHRVAGVVDYYFVQVAIHRDNQLSLLVFLPCQLL